MRNQLLKNNPNASGAFFMAALTIALMLLNVSFFWILSLIISARYVDKARKAKENKKLINATFALMIIAVLLWLAGAVFFAIDNLQKAGAV